MTENFTNTNMPDTTTTFASFDHSNYEMNITFCRYVIVGPLLKGSRISPRVLNTFFLSQSHIDHRTE